MIVTELSLKADRGDGSTKGEEQIAHAPTCRVGIEGDVAIVGDDVTVHFFQPARDCRIRHVGKNFLSGPIVFNFSVERKFAIRKIGIAASDEKQISREFPVAVERGRCFEGGVKTIARTESGQREDGGERVWHSMRA